MNKKKQYNQTVRTLLPKVATKNHKHQIRPYYRYPLLFVIPHIHQNETNLTNWIFQYSLCMRKHLSEIVIVN